jgi:hypothetical protein
MEASMPGAQFSGKRLNRRIAESPKETKEHERTRKKTKNLPRRGSLFSPLFVLFGY